MTYGLRRIWMWAVLLFCLALSPTLLPSRSALAFVTPRSKTRVVTTVIFPSATTTASKGAITNPIWATDDWVSESFERTNPIHIVHLTFEASDLVADVCGTNVPFAFRLLVNGTHVGHFHWERGSTVTTLPHTVNETFRGFGFILPIDGKFTFRIEPTITICSGGGSMTFEKLPGTVTME